MREKSLILIVAAIVLAGAACGRKEKGGRSFHNARFEQLRREATTAGAMKDFNKSDSIGRILYHEAENEDNEVYMAYGLICQSFYQYRSEGAEERLARVKEAEKLALETANDSLLSRIYNILGSYAVAYTHNFEDAKTYFTEAIKYARQAGAPDFVIAAECNISELYRSRGDTLGIKYDLDIYRYADRVDNKDLLLSASQHCAEYYLRDPKTVHKALNYIAKIKEIGDLHLHHSLMGEYFTLTDSLPQAEREFKLSIESDPRFPAAYHRYAELLNREGRYAESNDMMLRAKKVLETQDIYNTSAISVYKIMADNCQHLGDYENSYRYLQLYFNACDSIDNLRKTEDMQRYKVKFEVEKKEMELAHEKAGNRLRNIIIASICLIFILTVAGFMFYIRRRNRLHSIIVSRELDYLNKEETPQLIPDSPLSASSLPEDSALPAPPDDVRPEVSDNNEGNIPADNTEEKTEANENNGLSKLKADAIWKNIMHEISAHRIFTDPQISRDSFAERVGCNHTWFTQVIKIKTGKSYTQFMNSCRVDEAVKLLSSLQCDLNQKEIAAKVGFLSPSSFYAAFRQQIGMSPAEYRRRVIDINTEK